MKQIPQDRQINLQPGLRKLAIEIENGGMSEKHLGQMRGMVRVLDGLAVCIPGPFKSDDQVLHQEFDHLVADAHAKRGHEVDVDLGHMVETMLNMADDNVVAVSRTDCARVFAGALASAEEILKMPKPPATYIDEAMGMIWAICELMHPESCFPDEDLQLIHDHTKELLKGEILVVHALRRLLERIS